MIWKNWNWCTNRRSNKRRQFTYLRKCRLLSRSLKSGDVKHHFKNDVLKNIAIAYIRIWNGIVFTVFIHSYISNDQHSGFNSRSKTNRITVCDPLIISYTVSTGGRSDSHGYHPVSCLTYFQLTVKLLCLFRSYVIHWFTFNQHGLNDKKNNDMVNLMLVWDKCMNAEKHYSWFIQWILVEDRTDKQRRAVPFKKFGRRHPTSDF